jgi:hypothetical protein
LVNVGSFWSLLSTPIFADYAMLLRMATQTKGNVLRLYLRDEELEILKAVTEAVEIPQTEVMSRVMTAGLRALREAGNRLPLPLKFSVAEGIAETTRPTKARRL